MNNNAAHSCIPRRKCLKDIMNPPSPLNPPGISSQFINPVTVKIRKRINDTILTPQRVIPLLFGIKVPHVKILVTALADFNARNHYANFLAATMQSIFSPF